MTCSKNYAFKKMSAINSSTSKNDSTTETTSRSFDKIHSPRSKVIQRLHPDWRMIPHLDLFGWTDQHQQLEEYLKTQVKDRIISSIYFSSEREYIEAEFRLQIKKNKFLCQPVVNTVDGIFAVLEKYERKNSSYPFETEKILGR